MTASIIRVAAAQYAADRLGSMSDFRQKLNRWVAEATATGARLLVFPEFFGMEIASIADHRKVPERRSPDRHTAGPLPLTPMCRRKEQSLPWETEAVQSLLPEFVAAFSELASHGLSGQDCADAVGTRVLGRHRRRQGSCVSDRFRARLQAEAGARIVLVPCCADSARGYHRVRVGARARALENQAYVIQSPAIGEAPWSRVLWAGVGTAGIYAPPDLGPGVNGVIAQGAGQEPQWVYADLDLSALDRLRRGNGVIANEEEWDSHLTFTQADKVAYQAAVEHNLFA